jgi:hypothetical protein
MMDADDPILGLGPDTPEGGAVSERPDVLDETLSVFRTFGFHLPEGKHESLRLVLDRLAGAAYERGRAAGWRERGEADARAVCRECADNVESRRNDGGCWQHIDRYYDYGDRKKGWVACRAHAIRALPPAPPQEDRT